MKSLDTIGITEFVGSSVEFHKFIIKHKPSDFVVKEIPLESELQTNLIFDIRSAQKSLNFLQTLKIEFSEQIQSFMNDLNVIIEEVNGLFQQEIQRDEYIFETSQTYKESSSSVEMAHLEDNKELCLSKNDLLNETTCNNCEITSLPENNLTISSHSENTPIIPYNSENTLIVTTNSKNSNLDQEISEKYLHPKTHPRDILNSVENLFEQNNFLEFLGTIHNLEKDKRTLIYQEISKNPLLIAKTTTKNIEVTFNANHKSTYKLTLIKSNMTTSDACTVIASRLGLNKSCVSAFGNKDKRAVTYQQITVSGVGFSDLLKLAIILIKENRNVRICGIQQTNKSACLGRIRGNSFQIKIRSIDHFGKVGKNDVFEELNPEIKSNCSCESADLKGLKCQIIQNTLENNELTLHQTDSGGTFEKLNEIHSYSKSLSQEKKQNESQSHSKSLTQEESHLYSDSLSQEEKQNERHSDLISLSLEEKQNKSVYEVRGLNNALGSDTSSPKRFKESAHCKITYKLDSSSSEVDKIENDDPTKSKHNQCNKISKKESSNDNQIPSDPQNYSNSTNYLFNEKCPNKENIKNHNQHDSKTNKSDFLLIDIKRLEKGFINYFGQQRFGINFQTHLIGELLLKREYQKIIDLVMTINKHDHYRLKEAKILFQKEDYENCAKMLGHNNQLEKRIVNCYKTNKNIKSIFFGMRKEDLKLYYHAYQSYKFNFDASSIVSEAKKQNKISSITDLEIELQKLDSKHTKGAKRRVIEFCRNIEVKLFDEYLQVKFDLNPSTYATMALREIIGSDVLNRIHTS